MDTSLSLSLNLSLNLSLTQSSIKEPRILVWDSSCRILHMKDANENTEAADLLFINILIFVLYGHGYAKKKGAQHFW